ncbi:MAG: hypothetical protein ACOCV3_04170 [Halanaerobiales bacterium]
MTNRKYKIILLILILFILFYGMLVKAAWYDLELKVENKALSPGSVFSGVGEVVIAPESGNALLVEVKGHNKMAGEYYVISFPQSEVELYHGEGDTLLATDFQTSLEENIGQLNNKGRDQFTLGATIKNITSDKSSGEYETYEQAVIEIDFLDD